MNTLEYIYQKWIQPLSTQEQLALINTITQQLIQMLPAETSTRNADTSVSILNLHGLGAEIWHEVDAQAYVHQLRSEWEQ
jgi:hypothetical protein